MTDDGRLLDEAGVGAETAAELLQLIGGKIGKEAEVTHLDFSDLNRIA